VVLGVQVTVLVMLGTSVGGVGSITDVAKATSGSTADVLGHTLELIVTLLAAAENTTLALELVHGHSRESSGLMMSSSIVVNLVDGNSGVDNVGLDDLLVDDRLDGLVDVLEGVSDDYGTLRNGEIYVVDMFAADGGGHALALCGALNAPLVPELSLLLHKVTLGGVMVTVVKLAVLNGTELGSVCLGKNLAVLDGLDCAVVVILVDLLVYSSVDLLMLVRLNGLVDDSRGNGLMNCGVVVTRLVGEVGESCLDLVHVDVCGCLLS
jgi:hypothetical protein